MVSQLALPNIEERAQIADRAFHKFREMQTAHGMDAGAFANAKLDLKERLDGLRSELDGYLASEFGVRTGDQAAYRRWCESHLPFHWLVEFHGIMHNGGFDVIVGNPPYVSIKKIPYQVVRPMEDKFPDIYGHVLSKSLALTIHNGRCGMIIPLSITFSRDFETLRENLSNWGAGWYSSYDNIPAALFAGVSQRCTIWIGHDSNSGIIVAPMYRWRASYRSYLLQNLTYVPIDNLNVSQLGIPKLSSLSEAAILRAISSPRQSKYRTVVLGGSGKQAQLGFSQAARNLSLYFVKIHRALMRPHFLQFLRQK